MATKSGMAMQVELLHQEHGLSIEQIAESLSMPEETVTMILASVKPTKDRPRSEDVKSKIQKHMGRATEVLGELLEEYDAPAVRMRAAEFILKSGMGVFDTVKDTTPGDNIIQFNNIMVASNEAYRNQQRLIAEDEDEKRLREARKIN